MYFLDPSSTRTYLTLQFVQSILERFILLAEEDNDCQPPAPSTSSLEELRTSFTRRKVVITGDAAVEVWQDLKKLSEQLVRKVRKAKETPSSGAAFAIVWWPMDDRRGPEFAQLDELLDLLGGWTRAFWWPP